MNRQWIHTLTGLLLWAFALPLAAYVLLRLTLRDGYWLLAFANNFSPYYFIPLVIALPLALLLRHRRVSVVLTALTVVAGAWYGPRFVPRTPPVLADNAQTTLTVVSFNVYGNNAELDKAVGWLLATDADVILLQETAEPIIQDAYATLTDAYPYRVLPHLWGDAMLSRYPVENITTYDLEGDGIESHAKVDIVVDGQTIALYNVHLFLPLGPVERFPLPIDNPFTQMFASYDETQRNAQIDALLARVAEETNPYIVAGDFNMSDNAIKYNDVAHVMVDSYREAGIGFGHTWPVVGTWGLPQAIPTALRIDYIFHSGDFVTRDIYRGENLGSDHLPLVATLTLVSR
ncbi:MAG: endonuclease/exonuclease/phosphatase family protein [Chloroflexota bacterium]